MDIEFMVQMRQCDKCGSVRNDDIFNLRLGSGAQLIYTFVHFLFVTVHWGFIRSEYGKFFIYIYNDIPVSFWLTLTDFYLLYEHVILEKSIAMRKTLLWNPFVSTHLQHLSSKATWDTGGFFLSGLSIAVYDFPFDLLLS